MRIMNEVTYLDPHTDDINTLALDDPELFKYPMAYIIEVGWWVMTDSEAAALRAYLQKGGFLIVDDFKLQRWRGSAWAAADWERVRGQHEAGDAGEALLRYERVASDLSLVLRDRSSRHHSAGLQRRPSRSSAASSKTTIRTSACR